MRSPRSGVCSWNGRSQCSPCSACTQICICWPDSACLPQEGTTQVCPNPKHTWAHTPFLNLTSLPGILGNLGCCDSSLTPSKLCIPTNISWERFIPDLGLLLGSPVPSQIYTLAKIKVTHVISASRRKSAEMNAAGFVI